MYINKILITILVIVFLASCKDSDDTEKTENSIIGLQITPMTSSVPKGQVISYKATAIFSDNSQVDVTDNSELRWIVADSQIAVIDNASGVLTSLAVGSTNIVASGKICGTELYDSVPLIVTQPRILDRVLYPLADTNINSVHPDTNFGLEGVALINGRNNTTSYALIKFDGTQLDSNVPLESATLMVYFSRNNSENNFFVHEVTSDWQEDEVTWNNGPAYGAKITDLPIDTNGYLSVDVTPYVRSQKGSREISFALVADFEGRDNILTKEHEHKNPPRLILSMNDEHSNEAEPKIWQDYVNGNTGSSDYKLYDWSNVGYKQGQENPDYVYNEFHVDAFGAEADNGLDDTDAINDAIQAAGKAGGGIVRFSAGQYDINIDPEREYVYVNIEYDNVFLKGASKDRSTVLKQWKPVLERPELQGVHSTHTINFGREIDEGRRNVAITKPAKALTYELTVTTTEDLQAGDFITITMGSGGSENGGIDGTLTNLLVSPQSRTSGFTHIPYEVRTKVQRVIDEKRIEIVNPLPEDIHLDYTPKVITNPGTIQNVGIEDITITSSSNLPYEHHFADLGYGWGGIAMFGVTDGFIRNIHVDNVVQDISLSSTSFVSVYDILMTDSNCGGEADGCGGHSGIGIYGSDFSLVKGIVVDAPRSHLLSYNAVSVGNVITEVDYRSTGFGVIDHHGTDLGMRNLIENSRNLLGWNSGQGARFNVFWNISASRNDNTATEFLARGFTRLPRTIYVGVHSATLPLYVTTINNGLEDMDNEWFYLENMNNRAISIPSVYQAQLALKQD